MKKISTINIICIGPFNRKMFTPSWLIENIYELKPGKDLQGLFNADEMNVGFSDGELIIIPKENQLEIGFASYTEAVLKRGGVAIIKLIELLSSLPIVAIGLNIKFTLGKESDDNLVALMKNIRKDFVEYKPRKVSITKKMEDCDLNLIIDYVKNEYVKTYNFHYTNLAKIANNTIYQKLLYTEDLENDKK